MTIKPLERKNNWPVYIKLMLLGGLVIGAVILDKFFIKIEEIPGVLGKTREIKIKDQENLVKKVQETGGAVLGEAAGTVDKLTSDAGTFISDIIYENSIGKIVEQVDKLPRDQQERIREQICK